MCCCYCCLHDTYYYFSNFNIWNNEWVLETLCKLWATFWGPLLQKMSTYCSHLNKVLHLKKEGLLSSNRHHFEWGAQWRQSHLIYWMHCSKSVLYPNAHCIEEALSQALWHSLTSASLSFDILHNANWMDETPEYCVDWKSGSRLARVIPHKTRANHTLTVIMNELILNEWSHPHLQVSSHSSCHSSQSIMMGWSSGRFTMEARQQFIVFEIPSDGASKNNKTLCEW